MGKEIENLSAGRLMILDKFDVDNPLGNTESRDFTTAIEFTCPEAVFDNIRLLAESGKNIVCGTTGWDAKRREVKEIIETNKVGFVYASNFSIGMRMFMKIAEYSAGLFNEADDYDVMLHEFHHKRKKDSPSGTAITLANILLEKINRKKEVLTDKSSDRIDDSVLHVSSTRGGEIPGTHTIIYDSAADTCELTHRARNRKGFALGAIKAAELIDGKKGFFEFGDLLFGNASNTK